MGIEAIKHCVVLFLSHCVRVCTLRKKTGVLYTRHEVSRNSRLGLEVILHLFF